MTMTPVNDYKNALPHGFQLHEYRLDAVLGAGGFGITYLAQDGHLNKPVVIKEYLPTDLAVREASVTVAPKSTRDQDAYQWGLERFMAEAQTLAQFKHPNIVQVFRYFTAHGTAYIVMDYEQGESLSAYLDRLQRPLSEAEALSIFLPVLDGVRAVHQADFLHRDIKPDNIFLRANSTPILIDFGAARLALGERSRSLSVVVSAGFAPFEQYSSQGRQGPWTDIYALGATLYRVVSGDAPPEATARSMALTEEEPDPYQPLSGRLEGLGYSPAFLAAIDQALAFRGKDRPQAVREFQYLLQGKPRQNPTNPPEAAESQLKRANTVPAANIPSKASSPTKRLVGALVSLILGLGVLGIAWEEQKQQEKTQQHAQVERLADKNRKQEDAKLRAEAERLADEKSQQEEAKRQAEAERLAEEKRKHKEEQLHAGRERLAVGKRIQEEVKSQAKQQRLIAGRYWENKDGTLTDITTALQWMSCSLGQTWKNQSCIGEANKYTFNDALKVGRQTVFAGYSDWRVPTIDELKTLIYCSSGLPKTWKDTKDACGEGDWREPTIQQSAFPNTPAHYVWSSSPHARNPEGAWAVYFDFGNVGYGLKSGGGYIRLVRGGQ